VTPDPSEGARPSEAPAVPRRVWSGTALQVAGRLYGSACTAATLLLLARHLEPAEFGRFTFYLGVFALLDALSDFGTGQTAVQLTASDRWALVPVLGAARRIRLGMALVGLALVAALTELADEPGRGWLLLAALYPFTHALELSATVFKNRIAWGVPVAARAAASTLRLGLVLAMYASGVDRAPLYVLASALGSSLANLLLHLASRRHIPTVNQPLRARRSVLRTALPLGLAGLCQQAYFYVDNLFVRALEGDEPLGHYNGGVRLMSFLIMIAQYAGLAALPWLARKHEQGDAGAATARLAQPLFVGAALACGLVWPWADRFLALVLGEPFAVAGASMQWLLMATAVIYAGAALLTGVVATGATRAVLVVTSTALGVNLVGNAWLVPRLGIEGAALATFATELVVALGAALALVRAGASPFADRPLRWLAGPAVFALAAWLSARLPLA